MQAVLLFVNGLAVLNNERFLEPCTLSPADLHAFLQISCQDVTLCGPVPATASVHWMSADGWGFNNMTGGGHSLDSGKPGALKQQTIGLLHAVAYLRGGQSLTDLAAPPPCAALKGIVAQALTNTPECCGGGIICSSGLPLPERQLFIH